VDVGIRRGLSRRVVLATRLGFDFGRRAIFAGVKATASLIPAGWSQAFVLSAATGINEGMLAWGDRMLKYTGKPRADKYRDATHATIGYWTDNGGYYHYATGVNKSRTYEEVLPEVKASHEAVGVPFGHWQFDSWFYPKDGGVGPGGGGGAVTNWTALDSVFPSGMAAIQQQLKTPMVMHNRQWSMKSDYIAHESFLWETGPKWAIPDDPARRRALLRTFPEPSPNLPRTFPEPSLLLFAGRLLRLLFHAAAGLGAHDVRAGLDVHRVPTAGTLTYPSAEYRRRAPFLRASAKLTSNFDAVRVLMACHVPGTMAWMLCSRTSRWEISG